jgi:glycosyltransferase involved in cell wall biosynthesis
LIRNAAAVFAVSGRIARHAERLGAARVQVVPNGVSEDFFRVSNTAYRADKPTVVYVGTYTSWDGSEEVPALARSYPQVKFMMVGDGARRAAIREASPANVEFVGAVPYARLADYYGNVEAGIVLYEEERHRSVELSSLKVREYLACGLPVFSTDVPGQEFIREHEIGRLCRRDTMIAEFGEFLVKLAVYKANVERYRRGAGRSHSWEEAARITERAIREAAGEDA